MNLREGQNEQPLEATHEHDHEDVCEQVTKRPWAPNQGSGSLGGGNAGEIHCEGQALGEQDWSEALLAQGCWDQFAHRGSDECSPPY